VSMLISKPIWLPSSLRILSFTYLVLRREQHDCDVETALEPSGLGGRNTMTCSYLVS
jgi:hypothetical protein